MKNITTVGVDLAKEAIQVCVVTRGKVISNTEMIPQEFSKMTNQQLSQYPL